MSKERNSFSLGSWSGNTEDHLKHVKSLHQQDIDANPNASWVPERKEIILRINAELESRKQSK
jgi:hypothetical protein